MPQPASINVWDPLVRVLHWLLLIAVLLGWLSTLGLGLSKWHEPAGWVALAVVLSRITWGFIGTHYARFGQFLQRPQVVFAYARGWRTGARYLGHNPLGGWMIVALLATVLLACITGWLFTTDLLWGTWWLQQLHEALAWLLLGLAALHVTGVVVTSLVHRENLLAAMIHGRKAPGANIPAQEKNS